jgi:quinoprotein glucose dehydrogenase
MMTRIRSKAEAWSAPVLGAVMLIIGIVLAIGGGWLIALGGSFYYLPVGISLIVAGVLLWQQRFEGALLYLLIFLATLIWAWWEVGTNGWALVPRLIGPAVLLVLAIAVSPTLHRRQFAPAFIAASVCLLAITAVMFAAPHIGTAKAAASPLPAPTLAVNDASPLRTGDDWPAYGGSISARRYSPLKEINRDNVASLTRVWVFHTGTCL